MYVYVSFTAFTKWIQPTRINQKLRVWLLFCTTKITAYTDQMEKTRFVFKFVQAARSRKSKKKQTSLLSSMTSDTMSMDSSSTVSIDCLWNCRKLVQAPKLQSISLQSTEYRDSSITKAENLTDVDGLRSSLSADDSADLFCEDSGMYRSSTS